jgi:hypothetical protein
MQAIWEDSSILRIPKGGWAHSSLSNLVRVDGRHSSFVSHSFALSDSHPPYYHQQRPEAKGPRPKAPSPRGRRGVKSLALPPPIRPGTFPPALDRSRRVRTHDGRGSFSKLVHGGRQDSKKDGAIPRSSLGGREGGRVTRRPPT